MHMCICIYVDVEEAVLAPVRAPAVLDAPGGKLLIVRII